MIFLVRSAMLAAAIALLPATAAATEDFFPIFTIPDAPNVLLLNGVIDLRTPLAFRRALEANPQVSVLALNSVGGAVQAALLMAEEVHDRHLSTFVPESGVCASACAFILFAGAGRIVDGQLGVHQIYGSNDVESTQLNLSDIIETLTKYGVSPVVITKMLRTPSSSMYFFSKDEIVSLGIQADPPSNQVIGTDGDRTLSASPSSSMVADDLPLEEKAKNVVLGLIAAGSLDKDKALKIASTFYSDEVEFYGKMLSKEAILLDKASYIKRWPLRIARARHNTVRSHCESDICTVSGIYDWDVSNAKRNKRLSGAAQFVYQLRMNGSPVVIKENGNVISRNK